jgi:hypothetical protein
VGGVSLRTRRNDLQLAPAAFDLQYRLYGLFTNLLVRLYACSVEMKVDFATELGWEAAGDRLVDLYCDDAGRLHLFNLFSFCPVARHPQTERWEPSRDHRVAEAGEK